MKRVLDKFINYKTSIIIDGNFSLNYKNINEIHNERKRRIGEEEEKVEAPA